MIKVGIVDYIRLWMWLNKFVLVMVVVRLVEFDNGEVLFLKMVFEMIVLVIKVGLMFIVVLILKRVILIVEIIVKVFLMEVLIIV